MAIGNPVSTTSSSVASKTSSVIATAGQTLFTVPAGYVTNHISVFRNGIRLVDGRDYEARNGATVTLLAAATVGDVIEFHVFDTFSVADAVTNQGGTIFGDLTVEGSIGDITANNVTGVAATFTGAVSVGGVLTYEDVTNVDSIGIMTARSDLSIADKIIHLGDDNTAIRFPAADTFTVETGGSEALRVNSNQRLLVGHTAQRGLGQLEIEGTSFENSGLTLVRNVNSTGGTALNICKTRGSKGSTTAVQDDDVLGGINFRGADGANLRDACDIRGEVDGTPSQGTDMPGRLVFRTSADGSSSPTERLRIDSSGRVGIGTESPAKTLHVYSSLNTPIRVESTNANSRLELKNSGGTPYIGGNNNDLNFFPGGGAGEAARIDSSGRLLIGTSTPSGSSTLQVAGKIGTLGLDSAFGTDSIPTIYRSGSTAGSYPFDNFGHLIIQPRADGAPRDVIFATGNGGANKTVIDSSGRLLIGETHAIADYSNNLLNISHASGGGIQIGRKDTSVAADNPIGHIHFRTDTGSGANYQTSATIEAYAEDTHAAGDSPGRLVFSTTASGASSPTERMRITSGGLVGIGTNNPSGKLNIFGSDSQLLNLVQDSGDLQIRLNDAGAGSAYIKVPDNTGGSLAFWTGGSERLRITSVGQLEYNAASGDNQFISRRTNTTSSAGDYFFHLRARNNSPTDVGYLGFHRDTANDDARFVVGTRNTGGSVTERLRIDSSGKVAIGLLTTAPLITQPWTNLQVNGANVASPVSARSSGTPPSNLHVSTNGYGANQGGSISFGSQPDNVNVYAAYGSVAGRRNSSLGYVYGGYLQFNTSDGNNLIERMRIDSSGVVRIGGTDTYNGSDKLTLVNNSGNCSLTIDSTSTGESSVFFADGATGNEAYRGYLQYQHSSDSLLVGTAGSERMRIDISGRLFLFSSSSATAYIQNSAAASTSNYLVIGRYGSTNNDSGSSAISVFTNGNVQNINNSYGALSDIKLKENIVDANSQWEDIKQVQVRNYNLIEGETHTQIGVVAQEIETVSPGLVYESPDRDEEGNDLGTVTKSVNYSVLYMKAVKALQEAIAKIETLEASNADLVARVTALEG